MSIRKQAEAALDAIRPAKKGKVKADPLANYVPQPIPANGWFDWLVALPPMPLCAALVGKRRAA